MSTIYTLNGKVLKNAANDKWLTKKEVPPTPTDEITIGSQTWKAKNLEIDDGGTGITINNITNNYGLTNYQAYTYTYDAAVRVANTIQGWHIPSKSEFETLINNLGGISQAGYYLKATYGWNANGADTYGFTCLPDSIMDGEQYAYYWTTTTAGSWSGAKYTLQFFDGYGNVDLVDYADSSWKVSVRLIKDT